MLKLRSLFYRYTSRIHHPLLLLPILLSIVIYGCANRMSPGGGPYDETPPRLIQATPAENALQVKSKKVTLLFDEYVQIKDPSSKVIISPPQLQMPRIQAIGKKVTVELEDTLIPNTTYTIDFTNSIVDNNEGNELVNFSYAFSTGNQIDSMQIAGIVLDARNLEPISNIMVGVHPDSLGAKAFRDTTFLRMSRTSERPQFIIRNMKVGKYRVYALQENDANYRYNSPTEGIAFLDSAVLTTCAPAVRQDTIFKDSITIDTIQEIHYTRYMPNNLVLRYFTTGANRQYITARERTDSTTLKLTFAVPMDSIPTLQVVPQLKTLHPKPYAIQADGGGIVRYFLVDSLWQKADTFAVTYYTPDSLGVLMPKTDTIAVKRPQIKPQEEEVIPSKNTQTDSIAKGTDRIPKRAPSPLSAKLQRKGEGGISDTLLLVTTTPIDTTALKGIALYRMQDSIATPVPLDTLILLPQRSCEVLIKAPLRYKTNYQLRLDSLLFTDVWGNHQDNPLVEKWETKPANELSKFQVNITGVAPPFIVELLNAQDAPVRVVYSLQPNVEIPDLAPGKYYLRLVVDSNGDGKWTPGNFDKGIQPEMVYYAPKEFELLKNWKVSENWNPTLVPLSQQKPSVLIKNKPREQQKANRNKQREEELRRRQQGSSSFMGGTNPIGAIRGSGLF